MNAGLRISEGMASTTPLPLPSHGAMQRQCACGQHTARGGECEACKKNRDGVLQRVAISPSSVHEVPPIVHEVLRSPGQPLDAATRAFMEPRFGHEFGRVPAIAYRTTLMPAPSGIGTPNDRFEQEARRTALNVMSQSPPAAVQGYDFGGVRIHTGSKAAESARAVNAIAYTVTDHLVFDTGQYAPQTSMGQELLAHELTHVVQQKASSTPEVQRQEREKDSSELSATSYGRINMLFDGDDLIVYGDGQELFRYGASSGRPTQISEEHARECGGDPRIDTYMSPRFVGIKDNGPIPEGTYRFSPSAIQEFTTSEQLELLWAGVTGGDRTTVGGISMHSGDWGAGRVHLRPVRIGSAPCGNARGRGGFYLHGGLLAGSSGCIDIGTKFDELARFLQGFQSSVTVEVRYETQTPRVGFLTGLGGALAYSGFHFRHGPTGRLGVELGPSKANFMSSVEYQLFLDWAGGALSAGLHVDIPMNDEEAFIRAGLRGGVEFRLLRALYGQLNIGGFVESADSSSAEANTGLQAGAGMSYDFGRSELSLMYNYLKSSRQDERHQILLGLGLHW